MVEVQSLVVSDNLAHAASSNAMDTTGEGDIAYADWEGYLEHTFEQEVFVFDFNLFSRASKTRGTGEYRITDCKERLKKSFETFSDNLRFHLQTGDSVVILDAPTLDVTIKNFGSSNERVSSHQWMADLGLFEDRHYISDIVPDIDTDVGATSEYLQTVTNHYSYHFDSSIVKNPDILAHSPHTRKPAAFTTNEIKNENGKRMEVNGDLIILPQPSTINKPVHLMRLLVNTGWQFHEGDRTDQIQEETQEDKTKLSIPMSRLDDDLVEKCWSKYVRGEYRDAAARACQLLEHRVRQTVGEEDNDRSGASLMKHAFSAEGGSLSMGEKQGEKEGVMHLYAGAIQGIWNPLHHRPSGGQDKFLDEFGEQEAHDVISYVNFLLNLLPENHEDD